MGHVRLKRLPRTQFWDQVVELLDDNASIDEIAAASADASDDALSKAASDPALRHVVWLLTQLPKAAHAVNYVDALRALGIKVSHCYEAALIVERYSADWFSKSNFEGGITRERADKFGRTAFRKIFAPSSAAGVRADG